MRTLMYIIVTSVQLHHWHNKAPLSPPGANCQPFRIVLVSQTGIYGYEITALQVGEPMVVLWERKERGGADAKNPIIITAHQPWRQWGGNAVGKGAEGRIVGSDCESDKRWCEEKGKRILIYGSVHKKIIAILLI
ncbi:UNVERIFIED_CONTAM: hypothetical protein K2H54_057676 [Gekko kuhli]